MYYIILMNKYVIITARCNSTRLKNKILKKITNKHLAIDIIINRALLIKRPICLATSNHKSDDKLVKYVKKKYNIEIFRGHKENKVSRWLSCINKFKIDYFAVIDGDDLAFDYTIYKKNLDKLKKKRNVILKFPIDIIPGSFTYIFSSASIKLINKRTIKFKKVDVIEYFLKYIKNIEEVKVSKNLLNKKIRLTLDYPKDLKFFRSLFQKLDILESTQKIVKYLNENDNIRNINYFLEELWRNNQLKEVNLHEKKNI